MALAAARPETTARLTRGVSLMCQSLAWAPLLEVPLANGRRADVMAITPSGLIAIFEVKSCPADFLADGKWSEYAPWCDAFYFAVGEDFPNPLLPLDAGLVVADGFGGAILREPPPRTPLPGARRKAVTLAFARLAASRLALSAG